MYKRQIEYLHGLVDEQRYHVVVTSLLEVAAISATIFDSSFVFGSIAGLAASQLLIFILMPNTTTLSYVRLVLLSDAECISAKYLLIKRVTSEVLFISFIINVDVTIALTACA